MSQYKGFTSVELKKPQRSLFDLSHEKKLSSRIGKLTPVFITETLPNDTFDISTEVLVKLAPLVAPIFHRLNLYVHFFFVPQRLLWIDWEDFITGGRLGETVSTPPVPPFVNVGGLLAANQDYIASGSLADYLGIPPIPDADSALWVDVDIDARPFAAIKKIYMDYYRDRNFTPDDDYLPLESGDVFITEPSAIAGLFKTQQRAYQHDYLTSALPFLQRGPEVMMPLEARGSLLLKTLTDTPVPPDKYLGTDPIDSKLVFADSLNPAVNSEHAYLQLDGSEVSINEFRQSVALQQWLERNALAGSRYSEAIWAHFARRSSDARLQRAEYLGGGKAVIKIGEIMTTAYSPDSTDEVVPPANPTGTGSAYSTTNRVRYNCEEHGFIVGILSVLPTSGYMNGIPRMFLDRKDFLSYPFPTFAHLGEQPVYQFEVFADPSTAAVNPVTGEFDVWGYQSRYADWKTIMGSVHGDFRTTLDFWHLNRKFSSLPDLGPSFVTFQDSEQDRIFNVSGVDTLWMYIYNQTKVVRSLPYFGTPAGLVGK